MSISTSLVVFAAHNNCVPTNGWKSGWPLNTISSAGTWLEKIVGTPLASKGLGLTLGPPSSMSTAPEAASACATSLIPDGGLNAWDQGPEIEFNSSQPS